VDTADERERTVSAAHHDVHDLPGAASAPSTPFPSAGTARSKGPGGWIESGRLGDGLVVPSRARGAPDRRVASARRAHDAGCSVTMTLLDVGVPLSSAWLSSGTRALASGK